MLYQTICLLIARAFHFGQSVPWLPAYVFVYGSTLTIYCRVAGLVGLVGCRIVGLRTRRLVGLVGS